MGRLERGLTNTTALASWNPALPYAAAGTGVGVLIAMALLVALVCRKRAPNDPMDPILVYPSGQGDAAPQLISKQIAFRLPQMRRTESLDDLLGDSKDQPAERPPVNHPALQHRSNSFSWGYGSLGCVDPTLYRNSTELEDELQYPEGHLGRVWFYVRYEPPSERLLVTLLKIKNLPSRTLGTSNSCDPIVKLHLIPNERRLQQSRQKKKTCNPFYDETFVFQVSEKELGDHSLKMIVVDSGRRQGVIGQVTFPLRHLADDHPPDQLELLKMDLEKENCNSNSDLGEILISLFYNENLHRLTISVIAGRNLRLSEEREDSFVRVGLSQHCHTVKVKRTATIKGTRDPKYSQGFNFRVPSANVHATSLVLQVVQPAQGYAKGDKVVGKCVLGSYMFARGKALTHWNTAFARPMEQIQNWHPLTD